MDIPFTYVLYRRPIQSIRIILRTDSTSDYWMFTFQGLQCSTLIKTAHLTCVLYWTSNQCCKLLIVTSNHSYQQQILTANKIKKKKKQYQYTFLVEIKSPVDLALMPTPQLIPPHPTPGYYYKSAP